MFWLPVFSQDFWELVPTPDTADVRGLFEASNGYLFLGDINIYRSVNNGETWELCETQGGTLDFAENELGYIVTGSNANMTTDFGDTWTNIGEDYAGGSIIFSLDNSIYVKGTSEDWNVVINKTTNYGQDWETILTFEIDGGFTDITETSNGYIFTCTVAYGTFNDGVYVSKDKGETWEYDILSVNGFQAIETNSQDVVFAANIYDGIFKTYDYGETWEQIDLNFAIKGMTIDKEDNIYIACDWYGGPPGIFKSSDDGETWEELNSGLPPEPLGNNIFITPSNYLYCILGAGTVSLPYVLYRSKEPVILSIDENENIENYIIYPNPVTNVLNIRNTQNNNTITAKIYDSQGNLLDSFVFSEKYEYKCNHLNAGIYIIKFNDKFHKKFIKITNY